MAPPAATAAIEKAKTNMRCIHISSRAVKKTTDVRQYPRAPAS